MLALLLQLASLAAAQTLPLDHKVRYEKSLEEKVQSALNEVLGPGAARVSVDASLDFSSTEKVDYRSVRGEAAPAEAAKEEPLALPGLTGPEDLSTPKPPPPSAPKVEAPKSEPYTRQLVFPAAYLKKLSVTILLNKTSPPDAEKSAREMTTALLGLDHDRGDTLSVMRYDFKVTPKEDRRDAESRATAMKFGLVILLTLAGSAVVGLSFVKFADALGAIAQAQMRQLQSDLPKLAPPAYAEAGLGSGYAPSFGAALPGAAPLEGVREPGSGGESPLIDIELGRVEALVHLIGKEDPANVALVAARLRPGIRAAFLARLPRDVAGKVVADMAKPRFVEPERLEQLKEEIERRLKGAVGGLSEVLESLEHADLKTKRAILDQLYAQDKALAREVRRRTLFVEDLLQLANEEWALLGSAVDTEDWAMALHDPPAGLAGKLRAQMPESAWRVIAETQAAHWPSEERVAAALERIVATARHMIREGRIKNPVASAPALAPAPPSSASAGPPAGGTPSSGRPSPSLSDPSSEASPDGSEE